MKELSIEQKAEAYDKAIKIAMNNPNCFVKDVIEDIFPELKESEGEKIRKHLISLFENFVTLGVANECETADIKVDNILAWLEKQGEQKELNLVEILKHYPRETELYSPLYGKLWLAEVDEENEIITCYKYPLNKGCTRAILEQEDTVSFYSDGTIGLPDFSVSKDCMLFLYGIEKQSEQNPANNIEPIFNVGDKIQYLKGCGTIMTIEKIENGEYIFSNNMGHTTIENGNKCYLVNHVEQNPTWGEEDENMYRKVHNLIYAVPYCDSRKEFSDWLESLKDKVQSQPKQEWSEEDEQILNATILHIKNETYNYYGGYSSEYIMRWLKSLKDRYTWKPSDEDKKMLDFAIRAAGLCKQYVINHQVNGYSKLPDVPKRYEELQDWLKSLRPQSQWKPSDGQLECLGYAIEKANKDRSPLANNRIYLTLKALYEQLKKL